MVQRGVRDCAFPGLIALALALILVLWLYYRKTPTFNQSLLVAMGSNRHGTPQGISPSSDGKLRGNHSTRLSRCSNVNRTAIRFWHRRETDSLTPSIQIHCPTLETGNATELNRIKVALKEWRNPLSDNNFFSRLRDCSYVRDLFSPNNYYVAEEEENFPLGFVIVFHTQPQQIVRFLRVVYRPHNVYCLHPDSKSGQAFVEGFKHLAACLPNVVIPSNPLKVTYKHSSILEAQLTCMEEIRDHFSDWKWKYVLTLCGRELPFSSNWVIVDTLKRLHGSSLIGARLSNIGRRFSFKNVVDPKTGVLYRTRTKIGKVPYGIKIYKSSSYMAISRDFLNFIFTNQKARDFRHYMLDVRVPEEHFYPSLYMLPEAPKGDPMAGGVRVIVSKAYWTGGNPKLCTGKSVHAVCILNVADLPRIMKEGSGATTYFFFNKYFMEEDPVIMECFERRIVSLNKLEYHRDCLERA